MKKFTAFILACALCVSISACGGGNKKAFEASKAAYDNIAVAYDIVDDFGSDIYEAWRLGIYSDDELIEEGCSFLASELSLSESELREAVSYTVICDIMGDDWESASEDDKKTWRENDTKFFEVVEDELFSFCVLIVDNAYILNGKVETAKEALADAKSQMKELSEKYSDYEHYPNLKGYYTTTQSFFDFCQNPDGSFEQVKTTINDYRNEARDYISDLDYIFEG